MNCGNEKTPTEIVTLADFELLQNRNLFSNNIDDLRLSAAKTILPEGFITAFKLDTIEHKFSRITTGCKYINSILEGGLQRKCITEIYGESGCGKTQIGLQVAAHAWKTGAVYLSTEDTFPSKRLHQLFNKIQPYNNSEFGSKIFILQIIEMEDLIKCINVQLPRLLENNKNISVIILDSITAPFRGIYCEENSNINRAQHLKEIGINLLQNAKTYNTAILCINQVSANLDHLDSRQVIPCLGLVWSNLITTRIFLMKTDRYFNIINNSITKFNLSQLNDDVSKDKSIINKSNIINIRRMQIIFSPNINTSIIEYIITNEGIFSIDKFR